MLQRAVESILNQKDDFGISDIKFSLVHTNNLKLIDCFSKEILKIRESPERKVFIPDVTEHSIRDLEHLTQLMLEGLNNISITYPTSGRQTSRLDKIIYLKYTRDNNPCEFIFVDMLGSEVS